jgi:hypothetical protein
LKTEVVYLLHQEGVHSTELVFVDQLDVAGLNRSCQQLWITLVDHHVPIGAFAGLERAVQEIIDHHVVLPDKETDLIKYGNENFPRLLRFSRKKIFFEKNEHRLGNIMLVRP